MFSFNPNASFQAIPSENSSGDTIPNKLCVEEIDPELLDNIKCPRCVKYYFSPIHLCPKGHNLCNVCKEVPAVRFGKTGNGSASNSSTFGALGGTRSANNSSIFGTTTETHNLQFSSAPTNFSPGNYCGKCSEYFAKNLARRATAREKSIKILNFPCGNAVKKCPYRNNLLQIEEHEKSCIYAPRSCFFDGCDWKDTTESIINHIKEKHTFIVMNEPQILLEGINIYPLLYDSTFFLLKTSYSSCDSLKFSVLYPGENNKYKFDILFMGYNEDVCIRLTNYCELLQNETVKMNDMFSDDITVPFDCLRHFITDLQKLRFKINIIKIS
ncbi:hypothetical protein WA026_011562 [Henosepilachna vigintioctopunctata]|uniref:SIAH-type domain-containing protein n=1 Tax=Henosepilachna vigintioctopunctata TaxID=420089 RepID=A0AAW1TS74_9CUCU